MEPLGSLLNPSAGQEIACEMAGLLQKPFSQQKKSLKVDVDVGAGGFSYFKTLNSHAHTSNKKFSRQDLESESI